MPRSGAKGATRRARSARKQPSVAEKLMWEVLRDCRLGFKFRREHPVGPFRLDFYCREALLAVELDGEQHEPSRDSTRDEALKELGVLTFRIPNREFFQLDEVPYRNETREIQRLCEQRAGRKAFPDDESEPLLRSDGEGAGDEDG